MIRFILKFGLLSLILFSAVSCSQRSSVSAAKPFIITTIYPYELILKQLVDTTFTVETIIPSNASPHSWSPTPYDVAKLEKATLVISNGLGLETNLHKTLTGMGTKHIEAAQYIDAKLLVADNDVDQDADPAHMHSDHASQYNPHIWTNPALLIPIIRGFTIELGNRYPQYKDKFNANSKAMIEGINQTDRTIQSERERFGHPAVITLHDAFTYFFQYYKIEFIGAVQPSAGKDPSPKQLQALAGTIKSKGIKAIFIEPRMNPKPAEILARELKLQVIEYDDLGTTLDVENISGYLYKNWCRFKDGF